MAVVLLDSIFPKRDFYMLLIRLLKSVLQLVCNPFSSNRVSRECFLRPWTQPVYLTPRGCDWEREKTKIANIYEIQAELRRPRAGSLPWKMRKELLPPHKPKGFVRETTSTVCQPGGRRGLCFFRHQQSSPGLISQTAQEEIKVFPNRWVVRSHDPQCSVRSSSTGTF